MPDMPRAEKAFNSMRWLPAYVWQRMTRKLPRVGQRHLIFALADHFEPSIQPETPGEPASRGVQEQRLEKWCRVYPKVFDEWREMNEMSILKSVVHRAGYHWTVLDLDILGPKDKLAKNFESIACISVLEHIEDHARAMQNTVRLLATGGVLILTTPYSHHHPHPNVYRHPEALYGEDAPYICRSSSETELNQWLAAGLTLERHELWQLFTGPVWATGQRCAWRVATLEDEPHQLGCFAFRKR